MNETEEKLVLVVLTAAGIAGIGTNSSHNGTAIASPEGYDYEYDVDVSFGIYDWSELIPALIVYSTVLMLGISGNALIIFTITRYRRLKTTTNIFLASLASADLLLVLICVPVNVSR